MYLLYGYDAPSRDDPVINVTFESLAIFSGEAFPGQNIISIFPALRHLPTWFPGLRELHRLCAKCRDLLNKMQDIPFDSVKRNMTKETAVPSWILDLLEKNATKGEETVPEEIIKALGASLFSAGMETTAAFLTTFVLAMVLYPEVQVRAQAEIDTVVGNTRLPTHDDRASLPYVEALIRELFRWHGPTPLGIPHATIQDDVYNGSFIPKGTTVLTNLWAMWRDERVYPNPEEFKPERFLSPDGSVSQKYPPTFGFGRRVCVGQSMADASTWIAVASVLAVFRIAKAKDSSGNDIAVPGEFHDSIVSAPLPFECSITPRSDAARKVIMENPPLKFDSNPMYV